MLAWQVPYLGWRHFTAELSEFEISRFFTFEPEVHRAIRSRYKDTLRLGVALQLGFLTMCGRTLHAFQRVPAELLKHLGEQMEIPAPDIATLRALCQLQLTGALPPINHFTTSINRRISRRCSLVLLTIATFANVSWPVIGIRLVKRLTGETMSSAVVN